MHTQHGRLLHSASGPHKHRTHSSHNIRVHVQRLPKCVVKRRAKLVLNLSFKKKSEVTFKQWAPNIQLLSHPHKEALHEAAHPNKTEYSWQFLRTGSPCDPASVRPGTDRKDLKTETEQILVRQRALQQHHSRQPEGEAIRVVPVNRWMDKQNVVCKCVLGHYSTINRNEVLTHAPAWRGLENMMQRE